MDIVRWTPFEDLDRFRNFWGRFWENPNWFPAPSSWGGYWGPSVDVRETPDSVVVLADLPGLDPNDIEVVTKDGQLQIKGQTRHEERRDEAGMHMRERRVGSFFRAIPLPAEVRPNEARARYRDGVLEVTLPKEKASPGTQHRIKVERWTDA